MKDLGAVFYIETSAKYGEGIEQVWLKINIQLFTKAAQFMYKKYVTNGSFRNLVRPVMASIMEPDRAESFDLRKTHLEPQKKRCCF